jgi:hypothetical protein
MTPGAPGRYYGKFRGSVISNTDPMQMCRLMVNVPDVLGDLPSTWAMPCLPFTGTQSGLVVLPAVGAGVWVEFEQGAGVWVEFEQGDPDYPIWCGGWYGSSSEVPSLMSSGLPVSPSVVIATGQQTTVMLSDLPGPTGGILLKIASGASIAINDTGITIDNGQGAKISLMGPSVSVNDSALQVT